MEERFISLKDSGVDLSDEMKLDYNFLESYNGVHDKFHDVEMISASFNYNKIFSEKFRTEVDWKEFKNLICEEFKKLPYRPDHLYIDFTDIHANWFISDEYLLSEELGIEEIKIILKNLKSQLSNLSLCNLHEICPYSGERDITENMYFYNYYRKKQFEKVLLEK